MPQATLINSAGQKVVVTAGSQQAQQYFGQGYQLMGANGQYQAPQQPSLPKGAPQGSVAIPGAQYNTRALQQANFSQITPIGNTLYGVPNVASNLTSSQLTGGTPNVPAATANNQTSPDATMAGANQYMTQLQADLAAQQAQQQALESRLTAGQTSANDLLAQIGQKGTEYQSELEKYNYTANVAQLQDVNKQIASLTAAYNQRITDNQGRPILNAIIGGQESLLRRQQAAEVGGLSAIAQALQGNITLAQNTAKDAINVKYEPMENQLKQQLQQIEFLYNDLSRADQKKADAQTALLNERLRVMEEQKNTETNISNIVLTAAQNPNADINTLNAIRSAKTLDEAILIASGATPILTPAGLSGLTENQIIRVGNKIYKKGINLLAPQAEAGTWSIETDATGNPYKFNATTGQSLNLDGTPRITDNNVNITGATAKSIANAIKQVESGGNYNASGASGENGAYQFMPATWESWSREYAKSALGVDTPLSMSKTNQDFVAEFKIQQWLDQGLTPQQIAAKWNSGSEVGWENKVGVNSKGVKYDVPGYVKKVLDALSSQPGVDAVSGQNIPSEVSALSELVRTGRLTEKEALDKVSKGNSKILTEELAKISVEKIVSSYTDEMKDRTLQSVNELMGQVNPYTVGFGTLIKGVPTTAARSFASQLETLKASIAFGELTAMREASKTGGALGQVSDKEGQLLQNALGALDQGQSAEQFKAQLRKIKESIERWKAAANNYSATSGISSVNISDLDFKI